MGALLRMNAPPLRCAVVLISGRESVSSLTETRVYRDARFSLAGAREIGQVAAA